MPSYVHGAILVIAIILAAMECFQQGVGPRFHPGWAAVGLLALAGLV